MAKRNVLTLLSCVTTLGLTFCLPSTAAAQQPGGRVTLSVNGTYQGGTSDISSTVAFTANAENGSFKYNFPVKQGQAIDVSGTIRIVKNFGIGIGYSSFAANGTADVTATVPHPFFFNQPRSIAGQAPLDHKETAVHIRATLSSAPGGKFQFSAFVGPSFFSVNQGLVDSVSWTDSYPYDTASFTKATTSTFSASKVGFEGGADVAYYFSRNIGIGLMAAVAKAEVSGTNSDKTTISVSVGGSTVGAGLRLRF